MVSPSLFPSFSNVLCLTLDKLSISRLCVLMPRSHSVYICICLSVLPHLSSHSISVPLAPAFSLSLSFFIPFSHALSDPLCLYLFVVFNVSQDLQLFFSRSLRLSHPLTISICFFYVYDCLYLFLSRFLSLHCLPHSLSFFLPPPPPFPPFLPTSL